MHDHSLADFDPAVIGPRLEEAALILGCSRFVADGIRRLYPAVSARCHELYNGVDERFLEIAADPAASRTVLFVGRLCPEKGVHLLLSAMSAVFGRIAGEPQSGRASGPVAEGVRGPARPRSGFQRPHPLLHQSNRLLRSHYPRRERARRTRFLHGRIANSEICSHYARAGIFVFPSLWHEPFGIPVIEAMAAGLPVVATRGGAFPEVVVDGETGILVERGDSEGLAAAIAKLLADPHLRQRMGAAGRKRVRQLFTWDRSVARLEELYDGVLAGTALKGAAPELAVDTQQAARTPQAVRGLTAQGAGR